MSNDEQDYLWEQLEEMWPPDSKVKQSLSEEIEEFEVFPVGIIESKQGKIPLSNNNQIVCPFCNSKFGITIGISATRCPVCEERINL